MRFSSRSRQRRSKRSRARAADSSRSARPQSSTHSGHSLSSAQLSKIAASFSAGSSSVEARDHRRVEALLVFDQRRQQELLLRGEPVKDGCGARTGALGDVGDSRRPEPALGDHLCSSGKHLGSADVIDLRAGAQRRVLLLLES